MPIPAAVSLACLLAHASGASSGILPSTSVPESKLLALVGGGLIALAGLVRWLYPFGGAAGPKSMQLVLWIAPAEIAEQLTLRENR
jgi:hypothetical protein